MNPRKQSKTCANKETWSLSLGHPTQATLRLGLFHFITTLKRHQQRIQEVLLLWTRWERRWHWILIRFNGDLGLEWGDVCLWRYIPRMKQPYGNPRFFCPVELVLFLFGTHIIDAYLPSYRRRNCFVSGRRLVLERVTLRKMTRQGSRWSNPSWQF